MTKFIFNLIYRNKDGEFIDDENVWIRAENKLDALSKVKEEYPRASEYTLINLNNIIKINKIFMNYDQS